tara:strand:+ start:1945 stop:2970 length:1026 start_codon:yes stop_codon:yes gene_type:complete
MKNKIALITGVTGQDGSYLAEFLMSKNYIVHGIKRRTSLIRTDRVNHLFNKKNFFLHHGDMNDFSSIAKIVNNVGPDEIYNLAAQSHVQVSFEQPEYTSSVNAMGALRLLEVIKMQKKKIKMYQASTSEMFGKTYQKFQNEKSRFLPQSPYGIAKLYAYWVCKNYRANYKIFVSNGILFNHESPRRGETFVTKKIVSALVKIKSKKQKILEVGNLYSKRDWGHARDYVEAMWAMLQQKKPGDYCISTGETYTVKQFINECCRILKMKIKWVGKGMNEKAIDKSSNKIFIKINKKYFRPSEVEYLRGDNSLAKRKLKWRPKISFRGLVEEMIEFELRDNEKK